MIETIYDIPEKQDSEELTNPQTQVSAEEFNLIVNTLRRNESRLEELENKKPELPVASRKEPGIVKVGDNIEVTLEGTISVPRATEKSAGVMSAEDKRKLDELDGAMTPLEEDEITTIFNNSK